MQSYDKITSTNADAVFAYAVNISLELEASKWPSDEQLRNEYSFSPAFDAKMQKTIKRADKNKCVRFTPKMMFKKIASCLVLCLALFFCVLAPVQAVQKAVVSTFIEWYDQYIRVIFSADSITNSKLSNSIAVNYLPKSYTLTSSEIHDDFYSAIYKNDRDKLITITITTGANSFQDIDNEKREHIFVSFGSINNAIFSKGDNGTNVFSYSSYGLQIVIFANEPIEELIEIAENITF